MTTETEQSEKPPVEPEKIEKTEKTEKGPKIRDMNDAILELRRENEKLRKTLDETSAAKAEELSNQKLEALRASTEETAQKNAEKLVETRLAAIEEASKARLVKAELKGAAQRAGVVDFDDLYEILKKQDLAKVEFGDDGEVTNAGDIIAQLKEKKAHLFSGVSTASSERTPNTRETPKTDKAALAMSKEEYARGKARLARM